MRHAELVALTAGLRLPSLRRTPPIRREVCARSGKRRQDWVSSALDADGARASAIGLGRSIKPGSWSHRQAQVDRLTPTATAPPIYHRVKADGTGRTVTDSPRTTTRRHSPSRSNSCS